MNNAHTSAPRPQSWHDAHELAGTLPRALPPVTVDPGEALGATLAAPMHAQVDLPSADTAAMDGFAVVGRAPWTVVGEVRAGQRAPGERPGDGECVEVATGAPLPPGIDAVLPYEQATREGSRVTGEVQSGRHVRVRGEDCARGALLVPAGHTVTPVTLGLAASVALDQVEIITRPRVSVVVTGDELLESGVPGRGQVRDAIGPMLPGVIGASGGVLSTVRRLPDDRASVRAAIEDDAGDVVIGSGGSSYGPADHVRAVLADLGARVVVSSVACRPGHPQLLAQLPDGRWVLGLPGNPFAALAATQTLLAPLLAALAGRPQEPRERGRLAREVESHPRDTRLVPVSGATQALEPVGHDRPGLLWGAALADALAVIPPGSATVEVDLLRLPRGGCGVRPPVTGPQSLRATSAAAP